MDKQKLGPIVCVLVIFLSVLTLRGQEKSSMEMRGGKTMMQIYFIPFSIETYVPITINDIVDKSLYVIWFTKDHPLIPYFQRTLQMSPTKRKLDDRVIRMKVEFGQNTFFVDKEGGVLNKESGKSYRLSKKQLDEIENKILYFSGAIDVNATKGLKLLR